MTEKNNELSLCSCAECGHVNKVEAVDLWTLCKDCWSHLIPDSELGELYKFYGLTEAA